MTDIEGQLQSNRKRLVYQYLSAPKILVMHISFCVSPIPVLNGYITSELAVLNIVLLSQPLPALWLAFYFLSIEGFRSSSPSWCAAACRRIGH